MFILYGTGANGKSTFLNVIMHILGDYAISTYAETFMKRNNDTSTNDIARLRGTRLVTTTEMEQGKRLSEHLIKQVTGNDQLTRGFCMVNISISCRLSKFSFFNCCDQMGAASLQS